MNLFDIHLIVHEITKVLVPFYAFFNFRIYIPMLFLQWAVFDVEIPLYSLQVENLLIHILEYVATFKQGI